MIASTTAFADRDTEERLKAAAAEVRALACSDTATYRVQCAVCGA